VDQGDYLIARSWLDASAAIARELGDKPSLAYALVWRSLAAAEHFAESLALFRTSGTRLGIACCLVGFAVVARADGQPERGVRLFGAAAALLDSVRATLAPADRSDYERAVAALRAQMGTQEFAAAWADGQVLTEEQAIAYAIGSELT
jgi:hypothetical protein